MSRLASFRGPSTPSAVPVQHRKSSAPSSPSRPTETTYHRKVRTLLQELSSVADTWDTLVLIDGLKVIRDLVDTRTELENMLAVNPRPRMQVIGSKIKLMERDLEFLDVVIEKMTKQFRKINSIIDSLETLLAEAHRAKGWEWIQEPLWLTWSLEKFVSLIPEIIIPYHRSLHTHIELVEGLRSHSTSFECSRDTITKWVAQPWLQDRGWSAKWEEICEVEIERWNH